MARPKFVRHRPAPVPEDVHLETGERVLATAATKGDETVVITSRRFVVAGEGGVMDKPWHLVDAGRWDPENGQLTVTWVDSTAEATWRLSSTGGVPDAFHERVQASVVLVEEVKLDRRRRARVVLRKDLTSGAVLAQTIIARGCDPRDPELLAVTDEVAARLAEQVGREP